MVGGDEPQLLLPHCLDVITAADVIRRIEVYTTATQLADVDGAAEALVG